jgi:hypothetical protein
MWNTGNEIKNNYMRAIMIRYLTIAILGIFVYGCAVSSKHPITEISTASIDERILGSWIPKKKDESGIFHISTSEQPKKLTILAVDTQNKRGAVKVFEYFGHGSELNSNYYLNIRWSDNYECKQEYICPENIKDGDYWILQYKIYGKDELQLSYMDIKNPVIIQSIENGSLLGKIYRKNGIVTGIHIMDTAQKLRQFVQKNHESLFKDLVRFIRLKPILLK